MKRFLTLFISLCFFIQLSFAQSVPQGMQYQAVARDLNGQVLTDQTIFLKISLYSDPIRKDLSYVEMHKLLTNELGLFTLTIGQGQVLKGSFDIIPWSREEIWIEVAVQSPDNLEYVTISNSKMLSVPYAFHAATASELAGNLNRNGNGPGVPSQNWSLFGNSNSDASKDKLGTTDFVDLVFVTNNIERMRILANGDIDIQNSLNIGEDLTVEQNVYLNTQGGETINYGDFTVQNQSSTLLSGTLTVDLATDLNSSLNVDGVTNLNSSLFVNNNSPTVLSGTLLVEDDATFKEHVLLDNASLGSTSPTTGALVVNGGVGIGENLNVAGDSKFGGMVEFAGMVSITDLTESTSTTTGALKVAGGVGIGKRINVGGAAALGSTLSVTGATSLNNTLNVTGISSLTNATESSTSANGALVVTGGVGVGKNLNVGGTTIMNKELTVKGTGALGGHVAAFENSSNGNGISIKVGAATPHNSNNFVTFLNQGGGVVGRIEGENGAADLLNNYAYQDKLGDLDWEVFFASVDEATAIADEIQAVADLVAASTSSTACVGLGACVTAPVPSLIVAAAAGLIVATANLVASSAALVMAIDEKVNFESEYATHFGVTYASGSGDYAEYLPKLNPDEKFSAGDIVGMKHGLITRNTEGAERIMVISHNPIVLGKLPADGREDLYEMVAFLGQIPTKVMGKVEPGDYILSSGFHNGLGIARNPDNMKIEDYDRILGVAWEGAGENKVNMVNVAVGLNTNDMTGVILQQAELIKQQSEAMESLNTQIGQTNAILADLVPGFKESIEEHSLVIVETPGHRDADNHTAPLKDLHIVQSGSNDIIYFNVTRDQLEEGIKMAEELTIKAGVDMQKHPFWSRLNSDPSYRNEILDELHNNLEHAYHTHASINESLGK